MIDHVSIEVSDYLKAVEFYQAILKPLDYELLVEVQGFAGFGRKIANGPIAEFWLRQGNTARHYMHIAFKANSRAAVDAFHREALAVGAIDNGKPGIREIYHPNYYGAFILDLDGYNIEAVYHLAG